MTRPRPKSPPAPQPRVVGPGFRQRVYDVVSRVPAGWVTTYGDVGGALGSRRVARQVGFALAALGDDDGEVPWHRVINGQGHISFRGDDIRGMAQRARLVAEGIDFDERGRVVAFESRRFAHPSPVPSVDEPAVRSAANAREFGEG